MAASIPGVEIFSWKSACVVFFNVQNSNFRVTPESERTRFVLLSSQSMVAYLDPFFGTGGRCHKIPSLLCMDLWVKKWSELRAIGAWSSSRECGKPCLECALSFLSFCEKWAGADPIVICELIWLWNFQLVLQIFATILGKKRSV